MHVINSRYTNFSKMTSSQDLWGWGGGGHAKVWAELILSDRTNAITVKAFMGWIREKIRFVFFFEGEEEESVLLGWKKTLVISEWIDLSVVFQWIMLRVLYMDVSGGWGTFGPVGTGNLFLHAGNQGPNRHMIGQDDQYWTLHAELGDKSSHNNNN